MGLWAIFAIGAYFLLALNGVADKFMLSKVVKHLVAYAFYAGIAAPFTLFLWLLGFLGSFLHLSFLQNEFSFQLLSPLQTLVAILGGACFPLALYFSYKAIQKTSISRILPIQGGLVPVFTLFLAYLILGERLSFHQSWAFLFLVFGAVLISLKKEHGHWHSLAYGNAAISSFLFAMSLTLQKFVFLHVNFASGLAWTRIGFFLVSLSFLISKTSRQYIFNAPKEASTGNKFVYLGARVSGFFAGFLQNYAIKIGSVTLVNSLQGTQYAFLLGLSSLISLKFPQILKEKITKGIIFQKTLAIIVISLGLVLLVK
jgi:drug/metabolite transporter (DMT)-like permease